METSLQQVGRGNNNFQQIGYQINDVAAQVAAGTNAIQAFGQQAGQVLQIFGPWGAILGAAVAVGASFAATMLDGKDATEQAEKATEAYGDAVEFAKTITESSTETSKRHSEERRQEAVATLQAADAEKKRAEALLVAEIASAKAGAAAAARLKEQMADKGFGTTARDAGVVDVGTQLADQRIANMEDALAKLRKSATETGTLLKVALSPPKGWDESGFREPEKPGREKKEKSTRVRSIEEERDAVEEYIQSLRDAVEVQKLDERAGAIREATIRAQNMAMQDGTVLTDAQTEAIQRLAGASFDMAAAQKAAQEAQREADQRTKEELQENERLMKQVSMTFESAFEDAIIAGKKFSDVLNAIGEDIAKLIIRQAVTAPLGNAIQGAMTDAGGMGGIMGSLVSGVSGLFGGLTGKRETGGPVNANSAYLVGERGPEILRLGNAPGHITPNHKLGGLGGGSTTVINQTLQISTGVAATVQSEIRNMLPTIASVTKAAISNDQARKGRSL